ncbi:MAG: arylmalonate decarboxylase [Solirubrobacterales bacterium]
MQMKKIGVIIPSTNVSVERDYNALAPETASFHAARVYINNSIGSDDKAAETLRQIREGTGKAVEDVLTCQPDHLVLGMSSETFVGGLEGQRELTAKWEAESGLKVTTGADATRQALETIGARKIAVLTPYQPVIDAQVERYFDDLGYALVAMRSLRCPTAVSIAETSDEEVLAKIDEMRDEGQVDCFVQAGTNLSTWRLADEIERRTGKPHIAINAACVWHALQAVGVDASLPAAGRVFAGQTASA